MRGPCLKGLTSAVILAALWPVLRTGQQRELRYVTSLNVPYQVNHINLFLVDVGVKFLLNPREGSIISQEFYTVLSFIFHQGNVSVLVTNVAYTEMERYTSLTRQPRKGVSARGSGQCPYWQTRVLTVVRFVKSSSFPDVGHTGDKYQFFFPLFLMQATLTAYTTVLPPSSRIKPK